MYVQELQTLPFVMQKPEAIKFHKRRQINCGLCTGRDAREKGRMRNHWLLVWALPRHTVECKETKYRILGAASLWVKGEK